MHILFKFHDVCGQAEEDLVVKTIGGLREPVGFTISINGLGVIVDDWRYVADTVQKAVPQAFAIAKTVAMLCR
jgi:hypothetical protein